MAIVLKKGEAKRAAGVGQAIGQARLAEQQKQIKIRQAAEDRAVELELQKIEMLETQDFNKKLRDRQFAIDAEERARQWQIEKMELASRMDFEQEEKERLRKKAIFNSGIESIDSNEGLTDEQKKIAKFQLASRYMDIEEAAPYLGLKPQQGTGLFNLGGEEETPLTPTGSVNDPLGLGVTTNAPDAAPVSALPQAVLSMEQRSEFEVISPDGEKETITADNWPVYKSKGYVLAQIKRQEYTPETGYYRGFGGRGA